MLITTILFTVLSQLGRHPQINPRLAIRVTLVQEEDALNQVQDLGEIPTMTAEGDRDSGLHSVTKTCYFSHLVI